MNIRLEVPLFASKAARLGALPLVYANCGPQIDTRLGDAGSADHELAARAVVRQLQAQDKPALHVGWDDVYFCTPQVAQEDPATITGVTVPDIAKGYLRGCYIIDKAVAALAPYAKAIRDANLEHNLKPFYWDVENDVNPWNIDQPQFAGLRSMLSIPSDLMTFVRLCKTAAYNACCATANAVGLDGRQTVMLGATRAGQHNDYGVIDIPAIPGVIRSCLDFTRGTPAQLALMDQEIESNGASTAYVILDASHSPDVLKAQLAICRRHGVPDVTIFPDSAAITAGDTDAITNQKINAQLDALAAAGVR